jgi:NAD(P)-dependent dehydrogenase (short-subunit alcohol dehydrogenase family)
LSAAAEQTAAITNGIVDYLIVNGGYVAAESYFLKPSDYATQHDIFLDEFILCMRTNAAGLLYSVNAFLPLVKKSEIKKVVYMTSAHAAAEYMEAAGISMGVPYAMSKAAANVLVTKLAIESKEKGDGVVFLSLSPGMVFTLAETWEERKYHTLAIY